MPCPTSVKEDSPFVVEYFVNKIYILRMYYFLKSDLYNFILKFAIVCLSFDLRTLITHAPSE